MPYETAEGWSYRYTEPTTWQSLDWSLSAIDPSNLDYWRSIYEAALERASVVGMEESDAMAGLRSVFGPSGLFPCNVPLADRLSGLGGAICALGDRFVDFERTYGIASASEFPRQERQYVGSSALRNKFPGLVGSGMAAGFTLEQQRTFLHDARNALAKLSVTPVGALWCASQIVGDGANRRAYGELDEGDTYGSVKGSAVAIPEKWPQDQDIGYALSGEPAFSIFTEAVGKMDSRREIRGEEYQYYDYYVERSRLYVDSISLDPYTAAGGSGTPEFIWLQSACSPGGYVVGERYDDYELVTKVEFQSDYADAPGFTSGVSTRVEMLGGAIDRQADAAPPPLGPVEGTLSAAVSIAGSEVSRWYFLDWSRSFRFDCTFSPDYQPPPRP